MRSLSIVIFIENNKNYNLKWKLRKSDKKGGNDIRDFNIYLIPEGFMILLVILVIVSHNNNDILIEKI